MHDPEVESDKAAEEKNALLRGLTAHPGWQILRGIAESQITMRTNHIILTQLSPEFTAEMQEFQKGEVTGMRTLLAIPAAAVEEAKVDPEFDPEENE